MSKSKNPLIDITIGAVMPYTLTREREENILQERDERLKKSRKKRKGREGGGRR